MSEKCTGRTAKPARDHQPLQPGSFKEGGNQTIVLHILFCKAAEAPLSTVAWRIPLKAFGSTVSEGPSAEQDSQAMVNLLGILMFSLALPGGYQNVGVNVLYRG